MSAFNSYTVYDEEGNLITHDNHTGLVPVDYFKGLLPDVKRRAHVVLMLQEGRRVYRLKVVQPDAPEPSLGQMETLYVRKDN